MDQKIYKNCRKDHIKRLDKQLSFFKKINDKKNQKFRSNVKFGYKKNELIFVKNGFKHVRCIKCNFVFKIQHSKMKFLIYFFNEDL